MQKTPLLKIHNLQIAINNKTILNKLNLEINEGENVYLMGKNGAGKSTVGKAIMGHPDIFVKKGKIIFNGKNILRLSPDERSRLGIYLANQYPVEVPGVNLFNFLRIAYNSRLPKNKRLSVFKFKKYIKPILELLNISKEFLNRNLNEGFSGGEKKKNEILQMAVLEPKLAILDETDSGLDVDTLKEVFSAISKLKAQSPKLILLIITHYNRIIEYLPADRVVVLTDGNITKHGSKEIIKEIEEKGYR